MKKPVTFILAGLFSMAFIFVFAQNGGVKPPIMVLVQGGTFSMGSDKGTVDESPVHKVTVDNFSIGKYEVTIGEFRKFVDATGYITEPEKEDTAAIRAGKVMKGVVKLTWRTHTDGRERSIGDSMLPVTCISWFDANAYCNWLSKMTGQTYRLPTAAEWEFAANGGLKTVTTLLSGSNYPDAVAWYSKNSGGKEHTIGSKRPNELGIYDMSGNVKEWCNDWFGKYYYSESPELKPQGPDIGKRKVIRGGSSGTDSAFLRNSYRNSEFPIVGMKDFGFRVAKDEIPTLQAVANPEGPSLKKQMDEKGFADVYGIYFNTGSAKIKPESLPSSRESRPICVKRAQ